MSSNARTAAASAVAVAVVAVAAYALLVGPRLADFAGSAAGSRPAESVARPQAAVVAAPDLRALRGPVHPLSSITQAFHEIEPDAYDQAIAASRLSEDDARALREMIPDGKVRLATLTMSGGGQTISVTGAGLRQTFRLDAAPQTMTVPFLPGVPVLFERDKADAVPGTPKLYAAPGAVISMQNLVPGAEVRMSTPKN